MSDTFSIWERHMLPYSGLQVSGDVIGVLVLWYSLQKMEMSGPPFILLKMRLEKPAFVGMWNDTAAMENSSSNSLKILNTELSVFQYFHVCIDSQENWKQELEFLHSHVPKQMYPHQLSAGDNPDSHRRLSRWTVCDCFHAVEYQWATEGSAGTCCHVHESWRLA